MKKRLLILDNYDSFTFNLAQAFGALHADVTVVRADRIAAATLAANPPDALVISPGPGTPDNAGVSVEAVRALSGRIPILGVCLGHQAIGAAFGCKIVRAPAPMHGKTSRIVHDATALFAGVASPFVATRYHSLIVDETNMRSSPLEVCARTPEGLMMALKHSQHHTYGVQFHPESIMTKQGTRILSNFLEMASSQVADAARSAS